MNVRHLTTNVPVLPASLVSNYANNSLNLSAYCDFGNLHTYATGLMPLYNFDKDLAETRLVSGSKPVMATEAGYQTAIPTTSGFQTGDKPVTGLSI